MLVGDSCLKKFKGGGWMRYCSMGRLRSSANSNTFVCEWIVIYLWCVELGPSWAWLLGGSCLSWAASHWNRFLRHGDSSWRTWYQSTYQRSGSRHQYGSYSIHLASIQHTIFPSCASTSQIHTSHPTISLMSSCSSHHELVGIVASGWGTRYRVTIHPQRRGL